MWFNTEAEYNKAINECLEDLSTTGQKMRYFYYGLIDQDFLTSFDSLSYTENGRPYNEGFVSKDDEYLVYTKHGSTDVDDKTFQYKVNKYGFRSAKFEKNTKDKTNILVSGCSVTFGMALPEHKIWPSILKDNLMLKNKNIKIDNLAVSGMDTVQIIHNLYVYIKKFGKPDYIFLNLPPIYRFSHLERPDTRINSMQKVNFLESSEHIQSYLVAECKDQAINFFNNIIAIKQFEIFCELTGIQLHWMSWCNATNEYYKLFKFDKLILWTMPLNLFEDKKITKEDLRYWIYGRDHAHNGYFFHLNYADLFYQRVHNEI